MSEKLNLPEHIISYLYFVFIHVWCILVPLFVLSVEIKVLSL